MLIAQFARARVRANGVNDYDNDSAHFVDAAYCQLRRDSPGCPVRDEMRLTLWRLNP